MHNVEARGGGVFFLVFFASATLILTVWNLFLASPRDAILLEYPLSRSGRDREHQFFSDRMETWVNERKVASHPNISSPGLSFILPELSANTGVMTGPSSPLSPGDSGIETASFRLLAIRRNNLMARLSLPDRPLKNHRVSKPFIIITPTDSCSEYRQYVCAPAFALM